MRFDVWRINLFFEVSYEASRRHLFFDRDLELFGSRARALGERGSSEVPGRSGADPTSARQLSQIRDELASLRDEYEQRMASLETQLEELQIQMLREGPKRPLPGPNDVGLAECLQHTESVDIGDRQLSRPRRQRPDISPDGDRIDNNLNLREVEIDMRGSGRSLCDAVLIASFESETPGNFEAGIEEGYINIKKLPFMPNPLGLRFKVGRFRPDFGNSTSCIPTLSAIVPVDVDRRASGRGRTSSSRAWPRSSTSQTLERRGLAHRQAADHRRRRHRRVTRVKRQESLPGKASMV